MCLFITLVVSKNNREEMRNINDEPFLVYKNRHLSDQIPQDYIYGRATSHYCDCDSYFNGLSRDEKEDGGNKIHKLVKKGWSSQKIKRYKADKEKRKERDARSGELARKDWFNFLRTLLTVKKIKSVGILTHFYSGSLEAERVQLKEIVKIRFNEIDDSVLESIEEDKLYLFV